MRQLVFIHGRAQEHKDSIALKKEWLDAFREGLEKSGLDLPIPEPDVRFPYYGQTLFDLLAGLSPEQAAKIIIRGTDAQEGEQLPEEERRLIEAVLEEVLRQEGITQEQIAAEIGGEVVQRGPLNWGWVQAILKVIDRHVPGGSGTSIALFTHDAYQYITNTRIRRLINEGVRQAITPGVPTVVVGHSLGSVVAYNLLQKEGAQRGWEVPLFVTLGSPLGITKMKEMLAPIEHPACVGTWFNAMDERDVVALYPLNRKHFPIDPEIENKTDVRNHTQNRHGISGYLNDPEVARRIYDALD